ncbi:uncharacterized protein IL334_005841 [Kwoniella shivajii]|uniref:Uncharacterized protein n=1 Tax=Kwoniella shivajii TaxID=564305 RepID=A0ABZ1D489_9TREE|nr:hypothetical protein IL334_005841 [Kwoniella shivajii]
MSAPLTRIILCGKTAAIGRGVIAGLKPQVEVIRFVSSLNQANNEIPLILSGQYKNLPEVTKGEEILGTQNFNRIPDAVMLGGGYSKQDFEQIQKTCLDTPKAKAVPFFLADTTLPAPPLGPEYGKAMTNRAKDALEKWRLNLTGNTTGPIWY